ncbi:MAG: SRPBCC family protein [Acidimicrobiia bacterium]|nr:SRPBCC family protein [Acidimicrobiia bacterium]
MRELTDSIRIDSPPEPVWEWLSGLSEHYTEWHPDHVSAEWEHGEPNQVGSILRAVEDLGGTREVLRFEMTSVEPPHRLEYRIRGPISMLLPGGAFAVVSDDRGSRFTATISYRFGRLTERLFKRRTAALQRHMKEEGENLKRIIESAR